MTARHVRRWADVAYWGSWLVVAALYLWWPLTHLNAYAWSNDEGLYVQRAALANEGYPLYGEVLLNKPPLLVWILQLAFRLGGQTLPVARLTVLGLTLVGVLALGSVSRQLWGRWAGLATAAAWVGLPEIPLRAHAVMSDLPAMAFALVGIAATGAFTRGRRRSWLVVAGGAYAGGLLIHPLLLYLTPVLLAVLFSRDPRHTVEDRERARIWPDLAVMAGVAAGLGLLVLTVVDRANFLRWVLEYNIKTASSVGPAGLGTNWKLIVDYFHGRLALVTMASLGAVAAATSPAYRRGLAVGAGWLAVTVVVLLLWSPLWMHYLLLLAVPLVLVAGGGAELLGKWASSRQRWDHRYHRLYAILAVFMLGAAIWFIAGEWRSSAPHLIQDRSWSGERLAAQVFLEEASNPEDFVVTDDPLLAFAAERLVPPTLTEASYRHIYLGYLTSGDLVASTLRHKAPIALFATGRLEKVPNFERWVRAVAAGQRRDFGAMRAYELEHEMQGVVPVGAAVADLLTLEGYALSEDQIRAGSRFTTTLYWRGEGWIEEDYHVFVHLVGVDGAIGAQHDGLPLLGAYPTSEWGEGLHLPDPHPLEVDPATPSGDYLLMAGMYRWPSLERLPAYRRDGERWRDDLIVLTQLEVVSPAEALPTAASTGS